MTIPAVRLAYWKEKVTRMFVGSSRRSIVRARVRVDSASIAPAGPSCAAARPGSADAAWLGARLRNARTKLERISNGGISTNAVWLPSFVALGAADVALASRSMSRALPGLEILGAAGAVGLVAASARDLGKAHTLEQRLDAAGDLLWGAQGLLYLTSSRGAAKAAVGFGLLGALAQTAAGVLRVEHGIRRRDGQMLKLGALDVGGGLLWMGWDVAGWGQPLFVASYVVLMVGREAYANKEALARLGRRLVAHAQAEYAGVRDAISSPGDVVPALGRPALCP